MNNSTPIRTSRLTLVPATAQHLRAELTSLEELADFLDAHVPDDWPPGEYDRDAIEYFYSKLTEGGEQGVGWYVWYAITTGDADNRPTVIGAGGFVGPPDSEGVVEIGYSILPQWQRQGCATEMAQALVERAFEFKEITTVIAHTLEDGPASQGVLRNCGFVAAGTGSHTGTLRFERRRS